MPATAAPPGADDFAAVVRRYDRPLRAFCARLVGPDLSADAVQQTFLQALLALQREPVVEPGLAPWLFRIARNCSVDLMRRRGGDWRVLDPELHGGPGPAEVFEQREALAEMVTSLRALPEAQRVALLLREVEGRSYEEIAAHLGRSPGAARQAIFRARLALRATPDTPSDGRMSDVEDDAERELFAAAASWDTTAFISG